MISPCLHVSLSPCLFFVFILAANVASHAEEPKPDAAALIKQMRVFCSGLNSLACEIDYHRVLRSARLDNDRRAHFDVAFQRPNLLSILMKDDDAVTYAWISDGATVSTYMAGIEKFTTKKAPGTLGELLVADEIHVVRPSLDSAFLLDELLRPDGVDKLPAEASAAEYVGLEDAGGEKAHHLRLIRYQANWDLWISAGPAPLPLKIYSPLSTVEVVPAGAKTEFTVEFSRWLPGTALNPRVFQFDPSSKAKRASGFLPDEPPHPLLNQPAPAAVLEVLDGRATTLAAHRGRDIVVLDFWALSCVPCVGMLPKMDALARRFNGRGVVFYAMNENDAPEQVRDFFRSRGIGLTATLHNKAANFPAFKVDSIPRTFVIDKTGTIRVVHGVQSDDFVGEMSEQLEALLAGRELPKK